MVVGSNPAGPTRVAVLSEEMEKLRLRELLEMLLGEDGRRRLRLRYLTNHKSFALYDSGIVLVHQATKRLYEARRLIEHFKDFLGEFPPTPELGGQFLAQFKGLFCAAQTDRRHTPVVRRVSR